MKRNIIIILFYSLNSILGLVQAGIKQHDVDADTIAKEIRLKEYEIVRRQNPLMLDSTPGTISLKPKFLNRLPQMMGYTDPLRTLQLMPGVATTGEVSPGMYIRGSDPSQNLILFDGAPIYNAMHMIGFFSVFNNDHIGNVRLEKSYISPQYGGRTAGVLTVESNDRIPKKQELKINISLLASHATWSLPLSTKMGLTMSARTSYLNPVLAISSKVFKTGDAMRYGFNDYNISWIYKANEHHHFSLNSYCGKDAAKILETKYQATGGVDWRNAILSGNWEYTQSKINWKTTAYITHYGDQIEAYLGSDVLSLRSQIRDYGARSTVKGMLYTTKWTLGAEYVYHDSRPQSTQVSNILNTTMPFNPNLHTHESSIYAEAEQQLGKKITLTAGIRLSSLFYDPIESIVPISKAKQKKYYGAAEPRLGINYRLLHQSSLFGSYNRQYQYMNQVIVSGTGLPTNFWLPASGGIPPQWADAFSAGYAKNWNQRMFELSVELYYKTSRNQLESAGSFNDLIGESINYSSRYVVGKGENYGMELMFKKNGGKWSGWISYTLGWAWRQFPSIEQNRRVAASNDRRHDLSITTSYALSAKWDLSANFVFASGTPFTAPKGIYIIGDWSVSEYLPRNSTRMPAYHRIDLSATYNMSIKGLKESKLNLSIYNAYGNNNPLLFDTVMTYYPDETKLKLSKRLRSLFSMLPSISFSFNL